MIAEYKKEVHYKFGEVPNDMRVQSDTFVVMSDENGVCAVDFQCPCGCGSECYTPVTDATKGQPKTERHWLFSRGPTGRVTLSPSIRYTGGCKAHFNIEDGKVIMHDDSGK